MTHEETATAVLMVQDGMTYEAVGRFYGVSRQRIQQIAAKNNVSSIRPRSDARGAEDFAKNDVATKARRLVKSAIRLGVLVQQPCETCGAFELESPPQAHHDNYNRPLDVRWLCSRHHQEWHRCNNPIRTTDMSGVSVAAARLLATIRSPQCKKKPVTTERKRRPAEAILAFRARHKLTQAELAALLEIHVDRIYDYENGIASPARYMDRALRDVALELAS